MTEKLGRGGGYYIFSSGTTVWVYGMSAREKKEHEIKYGKAIFYSKDAAAYEARCRILFGESK